MKKGTGYLKNIVEGITEGGCSLSNTLITIDFNGSVIIDSFEKITDYNSQEVNLHAAGKKIKIHGDNMVITGCDRQMIRIKGEIHGIELE